eukprot:GAHX01000004.1.p1 GENE.GAHX01000004.1~~GAHX01000004.1.p1  ORF type:complete len:733 (-),score=142.94 GAHX01000004.1:127-2325(-)
MSTNLYKVLILILSFRTTMSSSDIDFSLSCNNSRVSLKNYSTLFTCPVKIQKKVDNSLEPLEYESINFTIADFKDTKTSNIVFDKGGGILTFDLLSSVHGTVPLKITTTITLKAGAVATVETKVTEISTFCIYSISFIFPVIVALAVSILLRNVICGTLLGIFVCLFIRNKFNPISAFFNVFNEVIVDKFSDPGMTKLILFIFFSNAVVLLLVKNKLFDSLSELVKANSSGSLSTLNMTLIVSFLVFFDDYASIIIAGYLFSPLVNSYEKHKLSFLIHSTSGTQSILIPLSSFTGILIESLEKFMYKEKEFVLLLKSIPFQFYSVFMLFFTVVLVMLKKDYGLVPRYVKKAQKRTRSTEYTELKENNIQTTLLSKDENLDNNIDEIINDSNEESNDENDNENADKSYNVNINTDTTYKDDEKLKKELIHEIQSNNETQTTTTNTKHRSFWIPIGILTFFSLSIMVSFIISGILGAGEKKDYSFKTILACIQAQDALIWASTVTVFVVVVVLRILGISNFADSYDTIIEAFQEMLGTVMILLCAGGFGFAMSEIKVNVFFQSLFSKLGNLESVLYVGTFLITSAISLSLGSSWGTLGIVSNILGSIFADSKYESIKPGIAGAMISGAVVGDHISLFSETTALTSKTVNIPMIEHFWGQLYYGGTVFLVSILFGYMLAGLINVWVALLSGLIVIVLIIMTFGREIKIIKSGGDTKCVYGTSTARNLYKRMIGSK